MTIKVQYYTIKELGQSLAHKSKPKIQGITQIQKYLEIELNKKLSRQRIGRILKDKFIPKLSFKYALSEKEIRQIFKK